MQEDSGAFKTNPAHSRPIPAFCHDPQPPLQRILTGLKKRFRHALGAFIQPICNEHRGYVAVLSNQPDSLRAGGARCVANAAKSVVTAFPVAQGPSQKPCEGGTRLSMLPGFRFLFAAIVLSMSVLVFGLGAAALLRAAHEEFASNPSWRAAPETKFAQPTEATTPTLAMLRADPPGAEQKASDNVPAAAAQTEPATIVSAPAEPAASASTPVEPDKIAAPKSEDSPPQETAKPKIPVAESQPQSESAPAQADAPAAADEPKIAASEQVSSPAQTLAVAIEATRAASEQASAAILADADLASTQIAILGGTPVTIEAPPPPKAASAKPDESVIKKRQQARRAAQRRRMALRARVAQQAPAQPAANPFSQPTITVRSR
jgi:hypothetical protein